MTTEAVAGFWSYAHDDDKLDDGAVLKLAQLIMDEYNLLSGAQLQLFIDRHSIIWGQEWRGRIDQALTQTTFFIPVITPRYFSRPECRRELLEFAAKAKGLGVDELLLPILYVEMQDFSAESTDEAVALVARTQYVDWRTTRLIEPSAREYRTSVNALARRLLDITKRVTEKQLNRELREDLDADGLDGITDIMEQVTKLLSEWLDVVLGEKVNATQLTATQMQFGKQIKKLQDTHAPASAVAAAQMRMAKEMIPLLEREQRDARVYLAQSIRLDPFVSTLARLINDHPDSYALILPLREAIDEAMEAISISEGRGAIGWQDGPAFFGELKHLGRIFQKCYAISFDAAREKREGNDLVRRWDAELARGPK